MTAPENASIIAGDTIPSRATGGGADQRRDIDSVNALIHALQEKTVQLERAQSELQVSREALLAAARYHSVYPRPFTSIDKLAKG